MANSKRNMEDRNVERQREGFRKGQHPQGQTSEGMQNRGGNEGNRGDQVNRGGSETDRGNQGNRGGNQRTR